MSLDFQRISHLNSQSRQALSNLEVIENEKQRLTVGMRRAAYQAKPGGQTDKINRLRELVEQAHESGQRVIVFSFFTTVIREVALKLGEGALEPITGAVSPKRRQEIVDAFTEAKEPKVLIGQIQAAGTGLNIQAASVIILCEPQIKPTLETQAIARAHRMGQVRTVRVHRLVIPQSIDSEMMNMLYNKTLEFDTYARPSHLADLVDHQMVDEQVAGGHLAESRLAEPEAKFASTLIRMERERLALDTSAPVELEDHVV
jgi:SNF2 family DNA or RNA helicase